MATRNRTRARAIAGLRGTHREGHGETAGEQDNGVRCAEANVQNMAAALKRGKIEPAVNGVGGEKAAKEHDFRYQENPDSQSVGLLLLFEVLELVGEAGVLCVRFGVSHRQPPRGRTRTLLR